MEYYASDPEVRFAQKAETDRALTRSSGLSDLSGSQTRLANYFTES